MKFIVYGLIDPRTLMIRYIGLSSTGTSHYGMRLLTLVMGS